MKIYHLVECNNKEYEDLSYDNIIITENIELFRKKIYEVLEDEDFVPDGRNEDYTYSIYVWENGKQSRESLFYFRSGSKMAGFNFLENFR